MSRVESFPSRLYILSAVQLRNVIILLVCTDRDDYRGPRGYSITQVFFRFHEFTHWEENRDFTQKRPKKAISRIRELSSSFSRIYAEILSFSRITYGSHFTYSRPTGGLINELIILAISYLFDVNSSYNLFYAKNWWKTIKKTERSDQFSTCTAQRVGGENNFPSSRLLFPAEAKYPVNEYIISFLLFCSAVSLLWSSLLLFAQLPIFLLRPPVFSWLLLLRLFVFHLFIMFVRTKICCFLGSIFAKYNMRKTYVDSEAVDFEEVS